jgi:hypothetical protein
MLTSMVFWKIKLGDLSTTQIDYLRAIAVAPTDFDLLPPDQERNVADGKAKTVSIARSESRTWDQVSSNWLDGSEEGSLGTTISGTDVEM